MQMTNAQHDTNMTQAPYAISDLSSKF